MSSLTLNFPKLKDFEFADLTSKGDDSMGVILVLGLSVAAAACASVLTADKIAHQTQDARRLVGMTSGCGVGFAVASGCSSRNNALSLAGFFGGAVAGYLGGGLLGESKSKS